MIRGGFLTSEERRDLTELVTASLVPPGAYVAGTIRLDYSAADVFVEAAGDAKTGDDAAAGARERDER